MEEVNEKVVMVSKPGNPVNVVFSQFIDGITRLGRSIKISPKANACINKAGFKAEYFVPTVTVTINIGKNYSAELIMTKDAFLALQSGEPIEIITTKEFKNKKVK